MLASPIRCALRAANVNYYERARRRFVVLCYLGVALLGACAALWPAAEPVAREVLRVAVDRAIHAAEKEAGRRLADVPTACEVEHHPADGQVLVLCTICYGLQDGETCR